MMDTKIFTIGGKKWRISVVETTRPKASLDQQDALVQAQLKIKEEQELDGVLLFVVDVLNEEATFISSSAAGSALVEAAWGVPVDATTGTCVLPGVLSRKKQIIPMLEEGVNKQASAQAVGVDATGVPIRA